METSSAVRHNDDPDQVGYSLVSVKEILLSLLDVVGARSVLEIGPYRGQLTRELLEWAISAGAQLTAVDPDPPPQLRELPERYPDLELLRETSHDALRRIPIPSAVIIDGDHNYYTVSGELRLIEEKLPGSGSPLLLFHDVGWPLARRDTYHNPERIPEKFR